MSASRWKAGDVAAVGSQRVFRHAGQFEWTNDVGSRFNGTVGLDARPLVVIDPEDREMVERVRDACWRGGTVDHWQAAIRSLVTAPKPDEPQGLGAVVEDDKGKLWIRCSDRDGDPWRRPGIKVVTDRWYRYDDFATVRVLSEGWSE